MLDNDKLNKRLKKIFKELKEKWKITPYRIAVETGIPHSSLKYMVDAKFEWKLNHLLSIIDFLNRYGAKTSLTDLLDFNNKKSLAQIMDMEDADFRRIKIKDKSFLKKAAFKNLNNPDKIKSDKSLDFKTEALELSNEIAEVVKDNRLYKNNKITIGLKINGNNFSYNKDLRFSAGKKSK